MVACGAGIVKGPPWGLPLLLLPGPVTALAMSPAGPTVISGSRDGSLRRWDLEGNAQGDPITAHGGSGAGVSSSPDGSSWISG
ncbi:hypothetical protein [Halomicronema hongdechloris]|uniref:hypothetical protein n=1 Tax=Halomicronema hongdechloris TaxID=1209493 RepID=UPI003704542C